jgi:hypothetical protein
MLRNRSYRGEIVHKGQSHPGEHPPIIDQPLWEAVQTQLAGNSGGRNAGTGTRQPSLLAGMLFDRDGNRMTPSYAVKKGTRYHYYVARPLITKRQTKRSTGLRIPAAEVEQLATSRVRQWLLDPGNIYQATQLPDPSAQRFTGYLDLVRGLAIADKALGRALISPAYARWQIVRLARPYPMPSRVTAPAALIHSSCADTS